STRRSIPSAGACSYYPGEPGKLCAWRVIPTGRPAANAAVPYRHPLKREPGNHDKTALRRVEGVSHGFQSVADSGHTSICTGSLKAKPRHAMCRGFMWAECFVVLPGHRQLIGGPRMGGVADIQRMPRLAF